VLALVPGAPAPAQVAPEPKTYEAVQYRESRALGRWWAGRLVRGVRLPAEGADFFTWDPALRRSPNRWWRRYGTHRTIRRVLEVIAAYRADIPWAPRVGIGDISRPRGGPFGRNYGGLGHASHQNGLDVDIVYPRLDGLEEEPRRPGEVDEVLAQELLDRFVDDGALDVYVGPRLDLHGPRRIVTKLVHHDDHMHVRFAR
jgi:murein endopeptidase